MEWRKFPRSSRKKKIQGVFVNIFVPICIKLWSVTGETTMFSSPQSAICFVYEYFIKLIYTSIAICCYWTVVEGIGRIMIHLTMKPIRAFAHNSFLFLAGKMLFFRCYWHVGERDRVKVVIKLYISTPYVDHNKSSRSKQNQVENWKKGKHLLAMEMKEVGEKKRKGWHDKNCWIINYGHCYHGEVLTLREEMILLALISCST